MRVRIACWFFEFYLWIRSKRFMAWFPLQSCMMCGKPYWGGWPRFDFRRRQWAWLPDWQDYCGQECASEDAEFCENVLKHDAAVRDIVNETLQPLHVCRCGSDAWGQYSERLQAFSCPTCGKWKPQTDLMEKD